MDYTNKTILITGASSGIGRAVAVALSRHNNDIFITARRKKLLDQTADLVTRNGSRCTPIIGDALDEDHCRSVVNEIVKKCGRIDIALLNIGHGPAINTLTASPSVIMRCMRTNFDTMINFFCPLIAQMKKQNTTCLIAHTNSLASYFGIPMQADYTAAKAAGRIFLDTARMELEHFGYKHILIQTIHPGFVDTEICRGDGIPSPNQISEEKAAEYILNGFKKEIRENRFPAGMSAAVRFGRIAPNWLRTRVLLGETPREY
jgi:NAD(P)-dependent dehydrogenase (short-subunit alcohol dehydrogenase family)